MATFSTETAAPVAAQAVGGSNVPQLRMAPVSDTSGMTGLGQGAGVRTDPNVDALLRLSSGILAPKIKQAQQEQFMRGVQEAMTGKALTEIINDRPWYTEIFGPSSAAEGARAYTVQAQLASFAADMETSMPKLAEQGPEAVRAAAMQGLQGVLTGDAAADALINASAVEQFAPLFKRHAKEHYVYLQNKASDVQLNAWGKASDSFQQQLADPKTLPADREAAAARLLGQIAPFADQTEDSYNKNVMGLLESSAAKGNFQILRLFKDTKSPGDDGEEVSLYERLPLMDRAALEQKIPTYARKALNQYLPKYAVDIAMVVNDTLQNPAGVAARVAELNAKIAADTGITEAQAIPNESVDNIVGNVLRTQAAEAGRVDPRAAQDQKTALAASLINQPGMIAKALATKRTNDEGAEVAVAQAWNAATTPEERASIINNRGDGIYDFVRADLNTMGVAGNQTENTKGVETVAATYAGMTEATRGAYFSAEDRNFYDRYVSSVRGGVPPEQAFALARLVQPLTKDVIPEDEKSKVQEAIRASVESNNETWYGRNTVTDSALRVIEAMVARDYRKNGNLNSVGVSVERAYHAAKRAGLDVIGRHAVIGATGQTPLIQMLGGPGQGNIGPKEVAERFDKAVETSIKSVGGSLDDYFIMRVADVGGDARFIVMSTDEDGIDRQSIITGASLRHKSRVSYGTIP